MAAKHKPKHRAPKRRVPRRSAPGRRESVSGNGSAPSSNGRLTDDESRPLETVATGAFDAEAFDVEPFDGSAYPPHPPDPVSAETPEPRAMPVTDTQQLPVTQRDPEQFPEESPAAEASPGDRVRKKTKPRSAAAEEFLMETPEFSLTRNRADVRQNRADAKADRKPKSRRPADVEPPAQPYGRSREERQRRQEESEHQTLGEWFREVTLLGLIAISSALFLTTYVVQAFFIPSESMEDTLQINDRVLVNKLAYRFGEPAIGDIVVFAAESDQVTGEVPDTVFARGFDTVATALGLKTSAQDLIKRVVAVEGQTVEIDVGLLYVDGEEVTDEPFRKDFRAMQDFGPETVPEDHVFVLGDNRLNSSDSRVFGSIPESSLVGKAFARIWPLDRFEWLSE